MTLAGEIGANHTNTSRNERDDKNPTRDFKTQGWEEGEKRSDTNHQDSCVDCCVEKVINFIG